MKKSLKISVTNISAGKAILGINCPQQRQPFLFVTRERGKEDVQISRITGEMNSDTLWEQDNLDGLELLFSKNFMEENKQKEQSKETAPSSQVFVM